MAARTQKGQKRDLSKVKAAHVPPKAALPGLFLWMSEGADKPASNHLPKWNAMKFYLSLS